MLKTFWRKIGLIAGRVLRSKSHRFLKVTVPWECHRCRVHLGGGPGSLEFTVADHRALPAFLFAAQHLSPTGSVVLSLCTSVSSNSIEGTHALIKLGAI